MQKNMEKIVVYDTGIPDSTCSNSVFDPNFAIKISHTLLPICFAARTAAASNINFITPEFYIKNENQFTDKTVFLISHLTSNFTFDLINRGVRPLLLTCQESPFIATRFYLNLKSISSYFKYTMVFSGMKKRVSKKTKFMRMHFPQENASGDRTGLDFKQKKGIVYIGSNKSSKNIIKLLLIKLMYGFSIKMIYPFRIKIIDFLSRRGDFELYGFGWQDEKSESVRSVYKGSLPMEINKKVEVISKYKFALCLENTVFPGYITEKIFDCFFAKSIPVYIGAQDIKEFIPGDTFIDINDFKSLLDLEKYIDSIDEEKYTKYMNNIEKFLISDSFKIYTQEKFADVVINLVNDQK